MVLMQAIRAAVIFIGGVLMGLVLIGFFVYGPSDDMVRYGEALERYSEGQPYRMER